MIQQVEGVDEVEEVLWKRNTSERRTTSLSSVLTSPGNT